MEEKKGSWSALFLAIAIMLCFSQFAIANNIDLTGQWTGTAIATGPDLQNGTFQVSAVIQQNQTSLTATVVFTGPGDQAVTFTETGTIQGSSISIGPQLDEDVSASGTISSNGMNGSGGDALSGTWNGSFTVQNGQMTGSTADGLGNQISWTLSSNSSVVIHSIDLANNALNVTLTGSGTGTLDLIATSPQSGNVTISVDNGQSHKAGTYSLPFDRVSLTPGDYNQVVAEWNASGSLVKSAPFTLSPTWLVFGVIRHSQYNSPYEDPASCGPSTQTAYILDQSCNFQTVTLYKNFVKQTYINGTGISISYGDLQTAAAQPRLWKACKKQRPKGATTHNSFLQVPDITGVCNTVLEGDVSVATYPSPTQGNPYACGDQILLVQSDNSNEAEKSADDLCPACSGGFNHTNGHIDNYTSNQACKAHSIGDLGNFWTADTTQ